MSKLAKLQAHRAKLYDSLNKVFFSLSLIRSLSGICTGNTTVYIHAKLVELDL